MLKPLLLSLFLAAGAQSAEPSAVVLDGVTVTPATVAAALGGYIQAESMAKGGHLLFEDQGKVLRLRLKTLDDGSHFHRLDERRFLAWAEFEDAKGRLVMMDFYFDWTDGRFAMAAPASVYKAAGRKRYDWDESGPFLRKIPVKTKL